MYVCGKKGLTWKNLMILSGRKTFFNQSMQDNYYNTQKKDLMLIYTVLDRWQQNISHVLSRIL